MIVNATAATTANRAAQIAQTVQTAQVSGGGSTSGADIIRSGLQSINPKQGGLIAGAIGAAEGTLNPDGSKRFTGRTSTTPTGYPYDGHRDPGDGKYNVGAFSFNHSRFGMKSPVSPQRADQLQLQNLRDFAPKAAKILSDAGVSTSHPQYKFLAANVMDLQNQLPITIPGRNGFANQLKRVVQEIDAGKDPRAAVAEGRARSFISSKDGRVFHFTKTYNGALADQRRRVDEMYKTFQANGGLGSTGSSGNAGNPRPVPGDGFDGSVKPVTRLPAPPLDAVASGQAALREGVQGPSVQQIQGELVKAGHLTQEQMNTGPGVFGPATKAAVESFQRAQGLEVDGVVGKNTRAALLKATGTTPGTTPGTGPTSPALDQVRGGQAVLSAGSQGEAVAALQDQLVRAGFMDRNVANGGRGTFGPNTQNAVSLFQVRNGIQPTGQVDQRTLQAIERAPTFNPGNLRNATGYQGGRPFNLTLAPIGTEIEGAGRRTAYLRPDAARSFLEMKKDLKRDLGLDLAVNDSFRSYEDQAARKRQYGRAAAAPGTSNHQQGLSLDLNVKNPRVEQWLLKNAHKYGFIRGDNVPDDLVRRLGLAREGHHYTYRPEYADNATPRYIQR